MILSDAAVRQYHADGFYLARGLVRREEIDLLHRAAKEDHELDKRSFGRADGEGGDVRLSLWNHPGDGIYGMFARCERMVRCCEKLLGGEVYHYHSKMIMKDAEGRRGVGVAPGLRLLVPERRAAAAPDQRVHRRRPCTKENGCLQVIQGSHHCGRIDHVLTGDQAGADRERVEEILKRRKLPLVYVEMEPGDALFFHSNLLHRSDQNKSENPRWAMICCYNARPQRPVQGDRTTRATRR